MRRRARRNSTHGGYVRGEWWITEDGESWYADQDIGEQGHEAIAVLHLLNGDEIAEGLLRLGVISPDETEDIRQDPVYALVTYPIPDFIGYAAVEKHEIWDMLKRGDAREAFMKHEGAIMVIGGVFTSWRVTAKTIRAIQNFIIYEYDDEAVPSLEIWIEAFADGKVAMVTWGELMLMRKPSELLWRHQYAPLTP